MKSIANVEIGIPVLPPHLKKATVFKEITRPLFSIRVVCDKGMEVKFCKKDVVVKYQNNKVVITGRWDTETPLWLIPIGGVKLNHMQQLQTMTDVTKNKLANSAYHQQKLRQLTAYLHACFGRIPPTT